MAVIPGTDTPLLRTSFLLSSIHNFCRINRSNRQSGFTLTEIVIVIVILGILSIIAVARYPSGLSEEAAVLEFKRAVRYAQHKAITHRFYPGVNNPWGISVNDAADQYTVRRADSSEFAEPEFVNRSLPSNTVITTGGTSEIYFNGLGEPTDNTGTLLGDTFISIGTVSSITVYAETGYVE